MTFRRFNHLNVPEHWEHYWSKYPQGYTILEALTSWVTQVDGMIDSLNTNNKNVQEFIVKVNKQIEDFTILFNGKLDNFEETYKNELSQTITNQLFEWYENGVLAEIINKEVFDMKADKTKVSYYATPEEFGAKADGNTDDSAAIQAAINSFNGKAGRVIFKGSTKYAIANTILVPWNINFQSDFTEIVPVIGGTFLKGYLFYLNADTNGQTITSWGGESLHSIEKLVVTNPRDIHPIRLFYAKSRIQLKTILAKNIDKVLLKEGSLDRDYTDMLTLDGVFMNNCTGTEYLVESTFNGDGLGINNCHVAGAAAKNWNFLELRYCNGGKISRQINGYIVIKKSTAVSVENSHFEHGFVRSESSDITMRDVYQWYHKDWQPIPFIATDSGGGTHPKTTIIDNLQIIHQQGRGNFALTYDADYIDAILINTTTHIRNFFRVSHMVIDPSLGMQTGVKISTDGSSINTNFEDMSQVYSKESTLINGKFFSKITEFDHPSNFNMYAPSVTNHATFNGQVGKYFYKAVAYFGLRNRKVGRFLGSESSVTLTDNTRVPLINIPYQNALQFASIRLYRGVEANVYTHYVDVPIGNGLSIYDYGYFLSTGEQWKARTGAPAAAYNQSYAKTIVEGNTMTVYGLDSPTEGAWLQGDKVLQFLENAYNEIICVSSGEFGTENPPKFVTK